MASALGIVPGDLTPLLAPGSIAVLGASASPGKAGHAMVRALAGFPGALHLVNPSGRPVEGRPVAPSAAALGKPVDLAVLVVPAAAVPAALDDCGAAGVRAAVVCSGGFAEAPGGAALQDEAVAAARRHGIRLLGPNTSGFLCPGSGTFATFVPGVTGLAPGPASFVTASGGVNLAAAFLAAEEGLGLAYGVGLGNAADVGFADVLDFLAGDGATRGVGLHVEGLDDGRSLCDAVARLAATVPVVALAVGRADVGDMARSHTGRLLADHGVARAALRQAGAVVVDDLGEMVDALRALTARRLPARPAPGVGVVTGQAGPGLLVADALRSRGVAVPPLADATARRLDGLLPPLTWLRNPVDTGRPSPAFGDVLALVAGDAAVDVLAVYALEEGDAVDPEAALATPGVAGALPVLFGTGGQAAVLDRRREALAALGVPLFRAPERLARAAAALVEDARARARAGGPGLDLPAGATLPAAADEHGTKRALAALGVAVPEGAACRDRDAAHAALDALGGGPVVVKVRDAAIAHKAAVGGVRLGVRGHAALEGALDDVDAVPGRTPGAGYLVEAEVGPGRDLLVGGVRDPVFGPLVVVGRGGSAAEAAGPPARRLVPLTLADLAEQVAEVDPALDPAPLAPVVAAVAALLAADAAVAEIDLNPVRLTAAGPVALDALVVRR
jgi:acetate---CoA ligase (ADP-forming)